MNRHRLFQFSTAALLLLLQRAPALRVAALSADRLAPTRIVALLRAAFTSAASLGAVHSLAGATTLATTQASPVAATVGTALQLGFAITGSKGPAASWTVGGSVPPGLTFSGGVTSGTINITNLVLSGTPTAAGSYTVTLRAWERINAGAAGSVVYSYVINVTGGTVAVGPTLTAQSSAQTVAVGGTATFSVTATGTPAPTYQWRKDGVDLAGATAATLVLTDVAASAAGAYTVVVSNSAGLVTSAAAALAVTVPTPAGPVITAQPQSRYLAAGSTATLAVTATGSGLSYQWRKDGTAIAGATAATYALAAADAATMGFYSVDVANAAATTRSDVAIVTVAVGGTSRLVNVSTRGYVPAGGSLTPGFVLQGSAAKSLVIRAVGPTLDAFGVGGALADPVMDVIPLGATAAVATNDNWGGSAALSAAFGKVGAFALAASSSRDASVETSLPAAGATGYTVRIASKLPEASGVALAEVYDEESLTAPVRLVNVSTGGFVGTGDQALVPGFVIGGTAPKQLLIRAVGPGLAQFGVTGTLADPQLSLVPLGRDFAVAANDNWAGDATLAAAATAAGAFALPAASADAVVLLRLPPGGYTVVVSGVGSTVGNALVEIYDLDR